MQRFLVLSIAAVLCFTVVQAQVNKNVKAYITKLQEENTKKMNSVIDALQWQMYHVGASAACAGVTNYRFLNVGAQKQNHNGWVFLQPAGQTCAQVCAKTIAKTCANSVRIHGSYGAQKQLTDIIGLYYTLGCNWKNGVHYAENTRSKEIDRNGRGVLTTKKNTMAHYCCCTQVRKNSNWKIVDEVTKKEVPSVKQ